MTFSMPGLIGAVIGLVIALGTYLAVVPLLERNAGSSAGEAKPNIAAIRTVLQADFAGACCGRLLRRPVVRLIG